jgi:hypothetical protein
LCCSQLVYTVLLKVHHEFLCSIHSFHFTSVFLWQSIHTPLLKGELFLNFIFLNRPVTCLTFDTSYIYVLRVIDTQMKKANCDPTLQALFYQYILIGSIPSNSLYNFGFLHHKSFRIFWSRCSITNLSNTFVTVHTNVQWRNTRMLAYLKKSDKYLLIPLLRVNSMWIVNWLIERNLGQHLLALKSVNKVRTCQKQKYCTY